MIGFLKRFLVIGGFAFFSFVALGSLVHILWNDFSMVTVFAGATGCGLANGVLHGIFSRW